MLFRSDALGSEVSVWIMDKDYYYLSAAYDSGTRTAGLEKAEALELTRWHGHRVFFSARDEGRSEKEWRKYLANVKTALTATGHTSTTSPTTQPTTLRQITIFLDANRMLRMNLTAGEVLAVLPSSGSINGDDVSEIAKLIPGPFAETAQRALKRIMSKDPATMPPPDKHYTGQTIKMDF